MPYRRPQVSRNVSVLTITLSLDGLDAANPGYQPPLPADQVGHASLACMRALRAWVCGTPSGLRVEYLRTSITLILILVRPLFMPLSCSQVKPKAQAAAAAEGEELVLDEVEVQLLEERGAGRGGRGRGGGGGGGAGGAGGSRAAGGEAGGAGGEGRRSRGRGRGR